MNANKRGWRRGGWLAACVAIIAATVLLGSAEPSTGTGTHELAAAELMEAAGELPGWKLTEPPRVVAGVDLFELIDGGAEIYQEYGFTRAVSCRYERGTATLLIELYQMADVPAAYGVYSMMQSPRGVPVDVGQAGRLFREYLVFWKGDYYASLTLVGEVENSARELTAAARHIAARVTATGERPAIMQSLPEAGLQDGKYLRGPIALSNIYVFGRGDVFGATEAACGVYADRHEFVFNYPNATAASTGLAAAREAMAKDSAYRGMKVTDEGFECLDLDGRRITASQQGPRLLVRVQEAIAAEVRP